MTERLIWMYCYLVSVISLARAASPPGLTVQHRAIIFPSKAVVLVVVVVVLRQVCTLKPYYIQENAIKTLLSMLSIGF